MTAIIMDSRQFLLQKLKRTILLLVILLGIINTVYACGYPGSPAHAMVAFSSSPSEVIVPGTVATYTCDSGFELLGPSRRVCASNGTWIPTGIPFCVLNVAVGKAPMQSSILNNGVPQKAIDGSTSTFFNPDTCTMTSGKDRSPWWYVNLLEPYMVQLVRLDFGTACCTNNRPATIVIRVGNNRPDLGVNPICNKYVGFIEEGRPLFLPCSTAMPGAFVSIYLEDPQLTPLSICEAFVYTDQALPIERCPSFRDQPLGSTATYNGKCYTFYNNHPRNLASARKFCEVRGGNLIDETNPALQGFLSWELFRRHRNDPSGQYWMGAVRDPRDPNSWKWINGQDVTISFWNLPVSNENCSRFDGSKGWLWSDTNCNLNLNFICQHRPSTCGKPERPENSTIVAKNYEIGSIIEYRCDSGHLLVGPNIRTCLASGFFSEFPPKCRYLECGPPASIPNGSYRLVNGTRHYLSTVQYICEEGHVLVGRGSLICDVDEKWNGPPPRCEPVYCRPPPAILNGKVAISNNSTVYGATAKYVCNPGYILDGRDEIRCVVSGYWDGDSPKCIELPDQQPDYSINSPVREYPASTPVSNAERPIQPSTVLPENVFVAHSYSVLPDAPRINSKSEYFETPTPPARRTTTTTHTSTSTTTTTTTTTTLAPSRVPPKDSQASHVPTWGLPGGSSNQHPGWTHPPLEIIPADEDEDGKDNINILSESPSNRIPSYEEAPNNRIPESPPSRHKVPDLKSPVAISPSQNSPSTPTRTVGVEPIDEVPIITIADNEVTENSLHKRNGNKGGSVKYGHKMEGKSLSNAQAKLNMGGIIALGVFGGFILLAITVTLILIFVRRTRSQRASRRSLDTTTITTYDGSSGAEHGLHKFYQKAWENLRYDGKNAAFPCGMEQPHLPVTRQETLDHPIVHGNGKGTIEGYREASEITVNDVAALYARPDKKQLSHSREDDRSPSRDKRAIREWYSQQLGHQSRRGALY